MSTMNTYTKKLIEINTSLKSCQKKEEKLLFHNPAYKKALRSYTSSWREKAEEKIPPKLEDTLKVAFAKAFELVFKDGKVLIDKTYDEDSLKKQYAKKRSALQGEGHDEGLNDIRKAEVKRYLASLGFATTEGVGLGLLGIGLPDVPILIANLIRTCMVEAKSRGFDPDRADEQSYMLALIQLVATPSGEREMVNRKLDAMGRAIDRGETSICLIENEIQATANTLSTAMLFSRFVMGLPIVGVAGGFYNTVVISQLHKLAEIKYEMRLLNRCKDDLIRQNRREQGENKQ